MKPWHLYRPHQFFARTRAYLQPQSVVSLKLPSGMSIEVDRAEGVGRSLVRRGTHDLPVAEMIHRLVKPGDHVVDLGANIGYFTQIMSARAGAAGQVWGFEPHPFIYARLNRNMESARKTLGYDNASVLQKAVSNVAGEAILEMPEAFETNQGLSRITAKIEPGSSRQIKVECSTLDQELGGAAIKLMKMDVEGHELQALQGAQSLLGSGRIRHIIFEDHNGAQSPVIALLAGYGYQIQRLGWKLNGPRLGALEDTSIVKPPEPPNFIATLEMPAVLSAAQKNGWQVL